MALTPNSPPELPEAPAFVTGAPELPPYDGEDEGPDHLDLAVTDTKENPPVQYLTDGATVKARIFAVAHKIGKKEPHRPMLEVILEAVDLPGVDVIRDYLNLPFKGSKELNVAADTELQKRKKIDAVRAFYKCFSVRDKMLFKDMEGLEGWVIVRVENDPAYGISQRVATYLNPPVGSTEGQPVPGSA